MPEIEIRTDRIEPWEPTHVEMEWVRTCASCGEEFAELHVCASPAQTCGTCRWYEPEPTVWHEGRNCGRCFVDPPVLRDGGWARPRTAPEDRCSRWETLRE